MIYIHNFIYFTIFSFVFFFFVFLQPHAATPSSLYAFLGPFAARQAVAKVHSFMQSEKLMKSLAHSMLLSVLERIFTGIRAEVE